MTDTPLNLAALVAEHGVTLLTGKRTIADRRTGALRVVWEISVWRRGPIGGKPSRYLFALIAQPHETPADLLRQLADAYDQGEVTVERAEVRS